jgi:hypothetical protein
MTSRPRFFIRLFEQFLVLLAAFGLVPSPTQKIEALDSGPPAITAEVDAPAVADPREPLVVRVIQTQITGAVNIGAALANSADAVTFSVLAVPRTVATALDRGGGVAALPAGLATAAGDIASAVEISSETLINALSEAIRANLALLGGGVFTPAPAVDVRDPAPALPGPVELVVRLPLAVGVAGTDLVVAVAEATTIVTGAVVQAIADIAEAAMPAPPPAPETETALREERLTLSQAIRRAPVTIRNGFTEAGGVLEEGVQRAATDFRTTLVGRPPAERALVSTGGNEVLGTPAIVADDTSAATAEVGVRPNRPRPVLGAVKTVTGTLNAVRDGVRTALGLPQRRPAPAAQNADAGADEKVDAATGS